MSEGASELALLELTTVIQVLNPTSFAFLSAKLVVLKLVDSYILQARFTTPRRATFGQVKRASI